jgi:site-specific recombinase XerD
MASASIQNRDLALVRTCALLLDGVGSTNTRVVYRKALQDFLLCWRRQGEPALNKAFVQRYKTLLIAHGYSASTINQRLTTIRQLALRASERGILPAEDAVAISRIKGTKQIASQIGNPLTVHQVEMLMNAPDENTIKGQRDRALLALLVSCGLRRNEVVQLTVEELQRRDERWVLVGVIGIQRKSRIVPLPLWAKQAVDRWLTGAQISTGAIFQSVNRRGVASGKRLSSSMVLEIVRSYGKEVGLKISPRDLRRACASLCRSRGADLEQIQMLLGHSSIQMTEQYLGARQKPAKAPNDRLGLRWRRAKKLAS